MTDVSKNTELQQSCITAVIDSTDCIINRMEYEAKQRLKWFIDGYFIHNLGSLFSKVKTERICELYNVEIGYFRPWV